MRRSARTLWLARAQLDRVLWRVLPVAIQCFAVPAVGNGGRWTACTATHGGDAITAWTSPETYATQFEAVCAAYWRARRVAQAEPPFIYCKN